MNTRALTPSRLALYAAALGALAALGACHNDDQTAAAAPPAMATTSESFTTFAIDTFKLGANTTPVNFDNITLIYDANVDGSAFNSLLM